MRTRLILGLLAVLPVLPGCSVYREIGENIVKNFEYADYFSTTSETLRFRRWAYQEWAEIAATDPTGAYSLHYQRGFIEGFVDYACAGGTGDPPPLPPRRYWSSYYQTPEGHAAMQDWFAGFRHGSSVAQAKGVRNLYLIPSSGGESPAYAPPVTPPPAGARTPPPADEAKAEPKVDAKPVVEPVPAPPKPMGEAKPQPAVPEVPPPAPPAPDRPMPRPPVEDQPPPARPAADPVPPARPGTDVKPPPAPMPEMPKRPDVGPERPKPTEPPPARPGTTEPPPPPLPQTPERLLVPPRTEPMPPRPRPLN